MLGRHRHQKCRIVKLVSPNGEHVGEQTLCPRHARRLQPAQGAILSGRPRPR